MEEKTQKNPIESMTIPLYRHARIVFALLVVFGVAGLTAIVFFLLFAVPKMRLLWDSLLGRLNTTCGCDTSAFISYPFVSGAILLFLFIVLFYLCFLLLYFFIITQRTGQLVSHYQSHRSSLLPLAFCHGYFRPKVFLSPGLSRILTNDEIATVISHERFHTIHHEPLKLLLVFLIRKMYFFFPIVGKLCHRYEQMVEVAADQAAIATSGSKTVLASALYKIIEAVDTPSSQEAVSFFGSSMDARVAHLENDGLSFGTKIGWRQLIMITTLLFGVVFILRIFLSRVAIAGYEASICPAENIVKQCRDVVKPICTMSYDGQSSACLP